MPATRLPARKFRAYGPPVIGRRRIGKQQLLQNSADGGVDEATVTLSDSGSADAWDDVHIGASGGLLVYDWVNSVSGGLGYRFQAGTSTTTYLEWGAALSLTTNSFVRGYFTHPGTIATNHSIIAFRDDTPNQTVQLRANTAGNLVLLDNSGSGAGTSAHTFSAGEAFRIEIHVTHSTTVGHIFAKLFYGANLHGKVEDESFGSESTNKDTGANCDTVRFGTITVVASSPVWWMDELAFSSFDWIGPVVGPYSDAVNASQPIHRWKLDELSGTVAKDVIGNLDGSYVNTPALGLPPQFLTDPGDKAMGTALASSETMTVAHDPSLQPFPGSYEFWFRSIAGTTGYVTKYVNGSSEGFFFDLEPGGASSLLYGYDGSNRAFCTAGAFPVEVCDDRWHHIVVTVGVNGIQGWADAQPGVLTAWTGTPGVADSTQVLNIGAYDTISFASQYTNDLAIYNYELPYGDILSHYRAGAPPTFTFANSAEGGTDGVAVTTGNSGGASGNAWDEVAASTGRVFYSNTNPATGSMGYRFPGAGSGLDTDTLFWHGRQAAFPTSIPAGLTTLFNRVYLYAVTGWGTFTLLGHYMGAGVYVIISSTGDMALADDTGTNGAFSAGPLSLGTLYRIEWKVVVGVTGSMECRLYAGHSTTPFDTFFYAAQPTLGDGSIHDLGVYHRGGASASTIYMDDIAISAQNWLGPSGSVSTNPDYDPIGATGYFGG